VAAPPRLGWGWYQLDRRAARQLVADAHLPAGALVVDVGAGHGAITEALVGAGHRVIAIELHPARAARLRARFPTGVVIVQADAADLRLPRRPFHVVANPPFGVTTALLTRLLHPHSRLLSGRLLLHAAAAGRWARGDGRVAARAAQRFDLLLGPPLPRPAFHPPAPVPIRTLQIHRR
jgi:23S rRNA (adenine-N6)-dimethyltransferase